MSLVCQVIESVSGNYVKIKGIRPKVLNLSSFDFFGFSRDSLVKEAARTALNKYGCGRYFCIHSCLPTVIILA